MIENQISQVGRQPKISSTKKQPTHHILVAEDDPHIRRINIIALTDSGYHVDEANDGAVAWETLQVKRYHLLITDNDMPKVSGLDLIKKIHAARMVLPVIMATGILPQEEFAENPWLQPAATLLKPYTPVELLGAVEKILNTTRIHAG
jgi:DNA-binding NtrC family response regulator